jgi:aspartate kinase
VKIVAKFGGSSVKGAEAIKRCCKIIKNNCDIDVVILSATYNSTNELEIIAGLAIKNIDGAHVALNNFFTKHEDIIRKLEISDQCYEFINNLREELKCTILQMNEAQSISAKLMDHMYSYGERLSTAIVYKYLCKSSEDRNPLLLDIRTFLITNDNYGLAEPIIEKIKSNLDSIKQFKSKDLIITQGFIGATEDGCTTTLGREGSDYSATLIAEAISADQVQIWTDVAGVATIDPKLVSDARFINKLSYEEATSLAENGAKILFPKTLAPAKRKNIPVFVKSSFLPNSEGTKICQIAKEELEPRVSGLALDNGLLTIVGIDLIHFEDKIKNFLTEFNAILIMKENNFIKYKFPNNSKLHLALYSLHGYLFSE